jgi:hypothetical protein
MLRVLPALLLATAVLAQNSPSNTQSLLHTERSSPGDLEVGGELAGIAAGSTRYVRYEDLLRLPLETYTVSDDTNFAKKTEISGVALTTLAKMFGQSPESALIVAICYDKYRTNYPRDYLAAHHPQLVLRIDGHLRDRWPKSENGGPLGPYLISHPFFKPSFKVLSHEDEPQIPFGVTRIEFRSESVVFGAIRPGSEWRENRQVQQGYIIARQDCFRCHNMGAKGGTMAGSAWPKLGELAHTDPRRFHAIIHDPASVKPDTKMPAQPGYDDATLDALTAYFKTFASANPVSGRKSNP